MQEKLDRFKDAMGELIDKQRELVREYVEQDNEQGDDLLRDINVVLARTNGVQTFDLKG